MPTFNSVKISCAKSGTNYRRRASRDEERAEKLFNDVILSEAKNLALRTFNPMRDSSPPDAAQNDRAGEFFRILENP
jgi:hypothetical protein